MGGRKGGTAELNERVKWKGREGKAGGERWVRWDGVFGDGEMDGGDCVWFEGDDDDDGRNRLDLESSN